MTIALTDIQKVVLHVVAVDGKGNPTTAGLGLPVWASSDSSKIALLATSDGLQVTVDAVGPLTAVGELVHVSVTATLHGTPVTKTVDFTVGASEAVDIQIVADTPVVQ